MILLSMWTTRISGLGKASYRKRKRKTDNLT
jgi:hypothetical protein